ncbi:MAG: ParB N-terminal domain-containing protein [Archangiaceae bacterium]|nr:ParB N-terminal domain-containing protein [Archangiaceae bacterium]
MNDTTDENPVEGAEPSAGDEAAQTQPPSESSDASSAPAEAPVAEAERAAAEAQHDDDEVDDDGEGEDNTPPAPSPPPPPPSGPTPHELKRIHPAPAHIALDRIDEDDVFKLRDEGDVAALAMDIARLGQVFPVDLRLRPPDRFQLITGFRRVAALKFLQREKVLARLHVDLTDDDAALIALAEAIHQVPVSRDELTAFRARLEERGRLSAAARDMLDKAMADDDGLAPEGVPQDEEEVDADELAADVATRLGQINQDLSLLADVFADLDEERREMLLEQLRYSAQLVAFLEGGGES